MTDSILGRETPDTVADRRDPETDTALEIAHPQTGEIVNVAVAETDDLAEIVGRVIPELRDQLGDIAAVIDQELLQRLDRRGEWTLRVGDPRDGIQWEIKAPSPTAGATTYDVDELRGGLRALVDDGTIDDDAARAALARKVTIACVVDVGADLAAVEKSLKGLTAIAGTAVYDVSVSTSETVVAAGMGRLRKIGGVAGELAARVTHSGTRPRTERRVTVKPKT